AEGRRVIRLELEPQTNLPFASGQHLPQRSKRAVGDVLLYLHGSGILAIEDVEKLKQRLKPHALGDVEPFRKPQIEIDERRCCKEIATGAGPMIDRIERSVAIRIFQRQCRATEMKSTLRAEDAADLKLPRKLQQTVELECMVHGKIRRTFIQVWSIDESVCLRDKASVSANERAARIGPARARFRNERRDADKTIGRQRVDSQLIISFVGERIVAA